MTRPTGWSMLLTLATVACGGPPVAGHGLDGAWRLTSAVTVAPDGQEYPGSPQESLLLVAGEYYSMNWASADSPADGYAEPFRPTDEEKLERYSSLVVNAGRLEVEGTTLTIRPDFALVPEFVGGVGEFDFALRGDTLDLVWRVIGDADGDPDPYTDAGVRYRYRWTRIAPGAP